jgi:hypothetical protein
LSGFTMASVVSLNGKTLVCGATDTAYHDYIWGAVLRTRTDSLLWVIRPLRPPNKLFSTSTNSIQQGDAVALYSGGFSVGVPSQRRTDRRGSSTTPVSG